MFLHRLYHENLAQASYVVGCQRTGEALVIDANREIQRYLDIAAAEGLRITAVTETHIHADFVSGSRELAREAGAMLYLSDEGGDEWRYAFRHEPTTTPITHGAVIRVGNVRLEAMHTPGHTPEHLSFLLTDGAATDRPMGIFTGDFLFVGDVGRPDLLERAAKVAGTMEAGARTLFRSLQRIRSYPDYLQIWPGHGAGSACGKALGAVPQSTLGYEKLTNWAFGIAEEDEFVRAVLAGQPEPPTYFAEMKRINKTGPAPVRGRRPPDRRPAAELAAAIARGAIVVDVRPDAEFAAGHVPGTISIPLNKSFTTWAGWLIPYDRDIYLLTGDDRAELVSQAVHQLTMIGLDRVAGYFGPEALPPLDDPAHPLETVPQIAPAEAAAAFSRGEIAVLDVRGQAEWDSARLPGALHIPLGELGDRTAELPAGRPIAVHCLAGSRSAIATGILQARGIKEVRNIAGGIRAWQQAGLPVETDGKAAGA